MSKIVLIVLIVLFVCVVCRRVAVVLGQPRVIGDIVAGVILGPALIDAYLPNFVIMLGLPAARELLSAVGELGLIVILVELCWHRVSREEGDISNRKVFFVSFFGIATSFIVGVLLAFYSSEDLGTNNILLGYMLFCGIAFSVTALPVLVMLLDDIKIVEVRTGRIAVGAAMYTDLFVWCALSVVIAVWGSGAAAGGVKFGIALVYVIIMLMVVKPVILKSQFLLRAGDGTKMIMVVIFVVTSAQFTDFLGLHSSVGVLLAAYMVANVVGVKRAWDKYLAGIRQVVIPTFFISSGGMIALGGLAQTHLWFWLFIFVMGATVSKVTSSYLAGLLIGMSQRASIELGVLMSTKGTAELVVLAVGYQEGLLSDDSYTVLLLLSVTSTMLTVPLLVFLNSYFRLKGICSTK